MCLVFYANKLAILQQFCLLLLAFKRGGEEKKTKHWIKIKMFSFQKYMNNYYRGYFLEDTF